MYYGMRRFDDITKAFIHYLIRLSDSLNFDEIFSRFRSEMYQINGISGISFQADLLNAILTQTVNSSVISLAPIQ